MMVLNITSLFLASQMRCLCKRWMTSVSMLTWCCVSKPTTTKIMTPNLSLETNRAKEGRKKRTKTNTKSHWPKHKLLWWPVSFQETLFSITANLELDFSQKIFLVNFSFRKRRKLFFCHFWYSSSTGWLAWSTSMENFSQCIWFRMHASSIVE